MPEKPKDKTDESKKPCEPPEKADESSWGKDIEEKDYYYDDAHGYEVFVPEDEDNESDK
ncbi:MAG: hypothetical protein WKF92_02180 [Pyrinomonadaceae bacterium]